MGLLGKLINEMFDSSSPSRRPAGHAGSGRHPGQNQVDAKARDEFYMNEHRIRINRLRKGMLSFYIVAGFFFLLFLLYVVSCFRVRS